MAKLGRLEKRVMLSDKHAEENLRHARLMLEHVDMEGKREYLELGCGGGQVVRFISTEYGLSCTGTDVDPDMVSHAETRSEGMEKVTFMVVDATDLPFEDGSFDLALSFGILHHISNWPDVMDEVFRVLRPGGDYILGDIVYSKPSKVIFKPFMGRYGVYTIGDLVEQGKASGFDLAYMTSPMGSWMKYYGLVLSKQVGSTSRA